MLITIRSPRLLRLAGWYHIPNYVTCSHKMWLAWFLGRSRLYWRRPNTEAPSVGIIKNLTDQSDGIGPTATSPQGLLVQTLNVLSDKKEAIMANKDFEQKDFDEALHADLQDAIDAGEFDEEAEDYAGEVETLDLEADETDALDIPAALDRRGEVSFYQEDEADRD